MSLTPQGFRKSLFTTEMWGTVGVFAFVGLLAKADPITAGVFFLVMVASFNVSRAIYKKNRGIYSSGLKTGEFYLTMVAHVVFGMMNKWGMIESATTIMLMGVNQAVYNLARGITKGVGVKTQVLMR